MCGTMRSAAVSQIIDLDSPEPSAMMLSLCSEDVEDTTDAESDEDQWINNLPACPVCSGALQRPMRAPCGHSFCAHCVDQLEEVAAPAPKRRGRARAAQPVSTCLSCAACEATFAREALHKDFVLASYIEASNRECPAGAEPDGSASQFQSLKCSVCMGIFHQPARAPCGHTFCERCIKGWLKNNKTCPEDRQPLQASALHRDILLEGIIQRCSSRCPYFDSGCAWRGRLSELQFHVKACELNPTNQPEWLKGRQTAAVEFDLEDDIDVEFLEQAKEEDSPPPASLMMRLLQQNRTESTKDMLCGIATKDVDNAPERNFEELEARVNAPINKQQTSDDEEESGDDCEMSSPVDEQKQSVMQDISNRLKKDKAAKQTGKKGWKKSKASGRWVKP